MKRVFILVCLLAGLVSCRKPFTVITYNVGVFSKYSESSLPAVASFILESDALLVSLNELDSCNRRHATFQLAELAEALGGWEYQFASAFPFAGGGYGNGVVSREPVLKRFTIPLPQADGAEPRSCAVVETGRCVFAAVHLDYLGTEARPAQVRAINDWFIDHYSGCRKPVLLCGDMNSTPDSETVGMLKEHWTQLSGTEFTYDSQDPHACIDFIFALKDAAPVKVLSSEVPARMAEASDHLPVVLRLR